MKNFKVSLLYGLLFMTTVACAMSEEEKEFMLQRPYGAECVAERLKRIEYLAAFQHMAQDTYNYPENRDQAYDAWRRLDQAGIKNHVPYVKKPTKEEMQAQFEKAVNDFEDYWEA